MRASFIESGGRAELWCGLSGQGAVMKAQWDIFSIVMLHDESYLHSE